MKTKLLSHATVLAEIWEAEKKGIKADLDPSAMTSMSKEVYFLHQKSVSEPPSAIKDILHQLIQDVSSIKNKVLRGTLTAKPLKAAITQYVSEVTSASRARKDKYAPQVLGMLSRFAEHVGGANVGDITRLKVNQHFEWMGKPKPEGGGLSDKTKFNVKVTIRGFLGYCVKQKWLSEEAIVDLKVGVIPKTVIRFFTAAEIDKVLKQAVREKKHDLAAAFAIACFAGPRVEEIHSLTRDRISIERRRIEFFDHKRNVVSRRSPIFDQLLPYLSKHLLSCGKIRHPFGESRSADALGRAISRLVRRALPGRSVEVYESGRRRSDAAQAARRSFSTHLSALNVSARRIAEWSGHRPEVDAKNYTGSLPDGERAYSLTFLGKKLIPEGLPCAYPEPGSVRSAR